MVLGERPLVQSVSRPVRVRMLVRLVRRVETPHPEAPPPPTPLLLRNGNCASCSDYAYILPGADIGKPVGLGPHKKNNSITEGIPPSPQPVASPPTFSTQRWLTRTLATLLCPIRFGYWRTGWIKPSRSLTRHWRITRPFGRR